MSSRGRATAVVAADFFIILLAYLLAYYVRFHGIIPHRNFVPLPVLGPLLALLGVLLLVTYDTHRNLHRPLSDTWISLALATVIATAIGMTLPYLLGAPAFPRSVFLIAAPMQFVLLSLSRWPLVVQARERLSRMRFLAIDGDMVQAQALAARVRDSFGSPHVKALGEQNSQRITQEAPDALFLGAHCSPETLRTARTWSLSRGVAYYAVPSLYDLLTTRDVVTQVGDSPVVIARPPAIPAEYAWLKRGVDIVGGLILGIIGLPFVVLAALLVRLTSGRPTFYTQTRVGLNGRVFTIYKVRTMRRDAEAQTGAILSSPDDPRVTPVGRALRALRIDELPQLWNVLKGEMSLVGPRPERPEFESDFVSQEPLYALRHNVRPGLTGLAQVSAGYAADWEEKLRHDLMYITNASPLLDLKIIILTLRAVAAPRKADSLPALARPLRHGEERGA